MPASGRYPTVAWIGLHPDPTDRRLDGSLLSLETWTSQPGAVRARDSDIAAAFAALQTPIRLVAFGLEGEPEQIDEQLTKAVRQALVGRASVIVIPGEVLRGTQANLTALALEAWNGGAVVFTTPQSGTRLAPAGAFNVVAQYQQRGRCKRTGAAAEDTLVLCLPNFQLKSNLRHIEPQDAGLVIASTIVATCAQAEASRALDGAVAALALKSHYPKPLKLSPLRCEQPERLTIASTNMPWNRRVSELGHPLDQKATLGPATDPALQLEVLVNPRAFTRELVAAITAARLTLYYLSPGDPSIGILRFLPQTTPEDRAAGTELIRSLRGTAANDLFSTVAADTFIDTK